MCISSEDSRGITESEINSQTFTESESKAEPVSAPLEKINGYHKDVSVQENIPNKPEPKVNNVDDQEKESEVTQDAVQSNAEIESPVVPQKPRITSEEEARAALAEKRRLAREQAEREAELERQRQEELRSGSVSLYLTFSAFLFKIYFYFPLPMYS